VVYSDLNSHNATLLESRAFMPSIASYAVIIPTLQVVLRSVAYSVCCDISEHNIPGYHLIAESVYSSVFGASNVSGEKADTTTNTNTTNIDTSTVVSGTTPIDPTIAPWCYIKKYSVGMDEYRYLGKTIDAVACTLQSFDCLEVLNHSVMLMLSGGSYSSVSSFGSGKGMHSVSGISDSVSDVCTWLPLPLNTTYSSKVPIHVHTTPLLAAPLLDVLIFCVALSIAAPDVPEVVDASPTRRSMLSSMHSVHYNPVWNVDHCVRWVCMGRLVQLMVGDIEEYSGDSSNTSRDGNSDVSSAFGAYSSVAPFLTTLYTQLQAHYTTTHPTHSITSITADRASSILLQWLTLMRAAAHTLYRSDGNRYTNTTNTTTTSTNTSSTYTTLSPPSAWVEHQAAESILVQSVADVTNAQIVRHLQLLNMTELVTSSGGSSGVSGVNSTQHELLVVCMKWAVDYTNHIQHTVQSGNKLDNGVFSNTEVISLLNTTKPVSTTNDTDGITSIDFSSLVTKPSTTDTTNATSTTNNTTTAFKWPSILSNVYACYPRASRPTLITLPREYTKLHALVMTIIANRATSSGGISGTSGKADANTSTNTTLTPTTPSPGAITTPSNTTSTTTTNKIDSPALCLVCGAVLDGAGKGQCAAHGMKCGGETGVFFLVQVSALFVCCMLYLQLPFDDFRVSNFYESNFYESSHIHVIYTMLSHNRSAKSCSRTARARSTSPPPT